MKNDAIWTPTPEFIETTSLYALMREQGVDDYARIHEWSIQNPEAFWGRTIQALAIDFHKPYDQLLDTSDGVAHAKWLKGAKLNIAESCLNNSPDYPAIVTRRQDGRSETMSVRQLDQLSNRVANGLLALGVNKGNGVAIDMTMTAESVAVYLGIIKAGAVVISIPDSLPSNEIAKRLRLGEAKAVFTQDQITRAGKSLPMYEKVQNAGAPITIVFPETRKTCIPLRDEDLYWDDFLSANKQFHAASCDPEDAINIIFSSGTTGDPKAIPWDHTTPVKCGSDGMYHQDIRRGDVVCWPTNLGWMMGPWLVFAALLNKATIALYEGAPTERGFCEFVQDKKVTMLGFVPSIVKAWRNTSVADGLDWSHIRTYSSSGEASNPQDYAWLMKLNQQNGTSRPIIEYCGGTEVGGAYAANILIAPHKPSEFNAKALGSDFVVLSADKKPCTPGEEGELFLIPPAIGLSTRLLNADNDHVYYHDCPVVHGTTLRRHGDQIIVGHDGRFQSGGRADDAMNLGGIKIGSVEIERTVTEHVDGIIEAAAVAVPQPGGGPDSLIVFVVVKEERKAAQKDDLKKDMQHAIRRYLNPLFRVADVVSVDSLPRTASNKVMRRVLRKQYLDGFAPASA
jgi:acetyl-CoA synthetase